MLKKHTWKTIKVVLEEQRGELEKISKMMDRCWGMLLFKKNHSDLKPLPLLCSRDECHKFKNEHPDHDPKLQSTLMEYFEKRKIEKTATKDTAAVWLSQGCYQQLLREYDERLNAYIQVYIDETTTDALKEASIEPLETLFSAKEMLYEYHNALQTPPGEKNDFIQLGNYFMQRYLNPDEYCAPTILQDTKTLFFSTVKNPDKKHFFFSNDDSREGKLKATLRLMRLEQIDGIGNTTIPGAAIGGNLGKIVENIQARNKKMNL